MHARDTILHIFSSTIRLSPSVPLAVAKIQNQRQKNLRGGNHAPRLVFSRDA